jgi:hypothetical protein
MTKNTRDLIGSVGAILLVLAAALFALIKMMDWRIALKSVSYVVIDALMVGFMICYAMVNL